MLQLSVPTLLLDQVKAKRNLSNMIKKAERAKLNFRPHFKTHQSIEIGEWYKDLGIERIAVSNLRMAEKFATAEWKDILLAIPVNLNEIDRINVLSERIRLGITVDCNIQVAMLNRELRNDIDIYIEIDAGYHRTGVLWNDYRLINKTIEQIESSSNCNFRGFLLHAGDTYKVCAGSREGNRKKILEIHNHCLEVLEELKSQYSKDYPDLVISYGDTPSCTLAENFGPVSEIRPGNFIFYDLTMVSLGVCTEKDIAVAMTCPVVSVNHKRKQVGIYGGAVHFSKDFLAHNGGVIFGKMVQSYSKGWGDVIENAVISGLSQEHGIVGVDNDVSFRRIGVGDFLTFLPVHSCLTADSMGSYMTTEGDLIQI